MMLRKERKINDKRRVSKRIQAKRGRKVCPWKYTKGAGLSMEGDCRYTTKL